MLVNHFYNFIPISGKRLWKSYLSIPPKLLRYAVIDLLLKFSKRKSLLSLVKLERELSASIGRKIDLLTEASISPYLRDRIKKELRILYEA